VPLRQQAEEAKGVVAIFASKLQEAQAMLAHKDAELGDARAELLQLSQAAPALASPRRAIPCRAAPRDGVPRPTPRRWVAGGAEGADRGAARHADAPAAGGP
jgi:hypothetical protein